MLDPSSTDERPRRRMPAGIGLLITAAASLALWLLIAAAAAMFFTWI